MRINKNDKKLTIGLSKKLYFRNNINSNSNSSQSLNTTRTKITINKNLLWKEQQEKNKNNNSISYDNKSVIKTKNKKSEDVNYQTPDLLKNEIEINLNQNFKNKQNYLSPQNQENNKLINENLNKDSQSELSLKKNNIKNINQTNFSFLLHQVSKNLNKTFSTLYENNNNRSLSSNNSLNNSIETNNTINFPQRKEINNLSFNSNLSNLRNSFTSLNSARNPINIKEKLKNKYFEIENDNKDNKSDNNISFEDNNNNKRRVYSNINLIEKNNYGNENCKIDYSLYEKDLEHYYILENKLKEILFKLSSYEPANNECYDWINYYFNEFMYNKLLYLCKDFNNRRNLTYIIKIELLCFCLCYHVSYDTNLSKVLILLKSIFEQIHFNYLILVRFILHKTTMTYENYVWYEKLYNIIKNELNIQLTKKDLDENNIIQIINNNINTIGNYFKLIIDNIYSSFYQPQSKLYKFPSTLYGKIEEKLKYSREIISSFFFDAFSFTDNYTIEDIIKFFNLFLFKTSEQNTPFILSYKVKFQNGENQTLNTKNINKENNNINLNIENKGNTINQIRSPLYYLPKINPIYKYSLVLDLDETLIYLKRDSNGKSKRKVIILRPFLHEFLSKMKKIYELILFSYEIQEYVDPIVDLIEKKEKYFEHRLYKQHTKFNGKYYIKDLSKLGRDIRRILIIDNISQNFKLQKNNGICIKPFYGDVVSDRNTLKFLSIILEKIRYDADESNDIRDSLRKEQQIIFSKITSNQEN